MATGFIIAIIKNVMLKKIFVLLLCIFVTTVHAEVFSTKAKSAFLIDFDSGDEIFSKKADTLMPPSSMLKLMTLTVLFDEIKAGRLKMDDLLDVSSNADYKNPLWYPASKVCLEKGQQISVKDAILGIIVLSGGDASVVVAENIAGSETAFTDKMLQKARQIGLQQSTFGNASGLPNDNNLMTSRELATLAKYIITEYPDLYHLFATKKFEFTNTKTKWCKEWSKTHYLNYNKLLFSMPSSDGLKTGHTDEGGYGVVASSVVGGRRLIAVINGFKGSGHDALATEAKKLLNYGYKTTKTKTFYKSGEDILQIPVWYGLYPTVTATTEENVSITLKKDQTLKDFRVLARYNDPVIAPVKQGQQIGEIIIEHNGDAIKRMPLIAKNKVRKIQFIGRVFKNLSVLIFGK
ncbi:MAG: D-alanyl-D-alanine carboxypeptidase [Alphaproteobacteria bacterium]|nr:D-alanyl-D-alanine carboxypeptidase [Alphaproteobacteria bacterium]